MSQGFNIKVSVTRPTNPDIISRIIMWFMGAKYSHIMIRSEGWIYHSVGKGVSVTSGNKYFSDHIAVDTKTVKCLCSEKVLERYVQEQLEKDYSQSQFIGFIFPWTRVWFRNGENRTICSEFVGRILNRHCGYKIKDLDFKSPKDIFEAIR